MGIFNTNFVFSPGKLTVVLDGGAGSSGKGKLGSFLCEHARNWQFACNTFMPQAGHWVELDDGRRIFYKTLNSCAHMADRYEKLYIGPGATIELPAFWEEVETNRIPRSKIGISHLTSILQSIDSDYESGRSDFDGNALNLAIDGGPLAATGSTAHGCGANRARRVLRRQEAKYARDVRELREFICDVPGEIMKRLDSGQSGLFEVAQGFQLSYLLPQFFPYTTSRNCTVAAGLDDMMVPPCYAGNVVLNFRTYPIRIHSNKFVELVTGRHLTWDEVQAYDAQAAKAEMHPKYKVVPGDSGPGYPDQHEISWQDVTRLCGSPTPIMEHTSVTKLPRRVFTFSQQNVRDAISHNRTNGSIFLSLNFANYVDHGLLGLRIRYLGGVPSGTKLDQWLRNNFLQELPRLRFIGTGPRTDDMIQLG